MGNSVVGMFEEFRIGDAVVGERVRFGTVEDGVAGRMLGVGIGMGGTALHRGV